MWASQTESHAEDPPLRLPGWFADILAQAPESQSSRLPAWVPRILGAQATIIDQGVLPFHSPYRDANSFNANGDNQVSQTYGLYLGSQLTTRLQFYFEMFQGDGISNGTGPGRPDQWGRHPPRCGAAGQGPRGLLPVPALSSRADKPRLPIHPEPWLQPRSRARACLRWTDPSEFLRETTTRLSRAQNPKVVGSNPTRRGRSITGRRRPS